MRGIWHVKDLCGCKASWVKDVLSSPTTEEALVFCSFASPKKAPESALPQSAKKAEIDAS